MKKYVWNLVTCWTLRDTTGSPEPKRNLLLLWQKKGGGPTTTTTEILAVVGSNDQPDTNDALAGPGRDKAGLISKPEDATANGDGGASNYQRKGKQDVL